MPESRLIDRIAALITGVFRAIVPDPFVIAVLLLLLACLAGLAFGDFNSDVSLALADKLVRLTDAFRDNGPSPHIWSLLAFTMQMCLVLVSGHVLASTPLVGRAITALANVPRSGPSAAALVGFIACLTGVMNWGLGLIAGALLAREVGRSLARRSIPHHYPIIAAAGYFGLMVWHGGFSGSAPLTMTSMDGARRTLPADVVERLSTAGFAQGVPLDQTLFTAFNAFITLGLLVMVPAMLWFLAPRESRQQSGSIAAPAEQPQCSDVPRTLPVRLDASSLIPLCLAVALAAGLWRFLGVSGFNRLGLNEIAAAMLVLSLVLHGSSRRFVAAVDEAASSCGGIIVQFPIYAAIIGVVVASGLIRILADLAGSVSPALLPATTFLSACVINLFVPSGGGQWAVQGPIALSAALDHGIAPGRIIMAVAYGDQLTNMLQPFWALPLLAITGVKAREIVGYTAIVMMLAGLWILLGLLIV